ncbi:A24 family peptidase [Acetobacter estunensis]|uniref:prepilin peptidase n=1 Tax=Acetobacter estunensis TaxID=104097 RepID=UPI001C2DDBAE|nr:A24 family peptidase [Acetobacter estunensis]MBV1836752.1 A24 family peptidase [Acetobacter estunensis]
MTVFDLVAGIAIRHSHAVMIPPELVIPFFLAPFVGSFLSVLVRRIPRGEPFGMQRSRCEECGTFLRPHEMIPLLSYLAQRGACRRCGGRIDPQHLKIELAAILVPATALLGRMGVAHFQGLPLEDSGISLPLLMSDCVLGWTLLALSWIDLTCLRLPDVLTLPLLLAGLAEGWLTGGMDTLLDRALGSGIGWALFALVAYGYRAFRKRTGLGGGDVKLLAAGGAWLGISALPSVIVLGSAFGILAALASILRAGRFSMTIVVPFGPCLAAAIWTARLMPGTY